MRRAQAVLEDDAQQRNRQRRVLSRLTWAAGIGTCAAGLVWWVAPLAVMMIGLGFYALHNTLQTTATQMTPQARGTAVAIFSSAIYLGQSVGVATAAIVFDQFGAAPLFVASGIVLPALAVSFGRALQRHLRRS